MTQASIERVRAVAASWEAACRAHDNAAIVGHLADDALVWYNFQPDTEHPKSAYFDILESSAETFTNQRYIDMRLHFHPGGFVEQATLVGDTPKGVVETPFLLIATVEGDKITRIAEYFDTTIMHQAGLVGG